MMAAIKKNTALFFIIPSLIGFGLFYILPFIYSLGYAVVDKPVNGSFVGLSNFMDLLQNAAYLKGLSNTVWFIGVSIPIGMALSLAVAMLVNRQKRAKVVIMLLFLIPLVIPSGSMVFFWKSFFAYDGYLNGLLHAVGLPIVNWLETEKVRFVIVLIFLWKSLGYSIVLFVAGLNNISEEYYQAAAVDGAGVFQTLRHITLANLAPTFILVMIMSVINSFKVFKEIYVITGSYPHDSIYMLQHFMNNMFTSLNYPRLTSATCILVVTVTLITQMLLKAEGKVSE